MQPLGSSKPLWLLLTTQWLTTRSSHSHGGCLKPGTFPQNPRGNKTGKSWEINFVCSSDWKGLQNSFKIQIYNIHEKKWALPPLSLKCCRIKKILKWNEIKFSEIQRLHPPWTLKCCRVKPFLKMRHSLLSILLLCSGHYHKVRCKKWELSLFHKPHIYCISDRTCSLFRHDDWKLISN